MKKIGILLLVMIAATGAFAQNRSVTFETGSFADALKKAKELNRPIFLDAYASWCGPCKMMANKVFTQDKVADYFNSKFVNVHFDVEKGEGVEIAKKYKIESLPTFLVISKDGVLMHRVLGASKADDFMAKIEEAFSQNSLSALTKKYESGERGFEFSVAYVKALRGASEKDKAFLVAKETLNKASSAEKLTFNGWLLMNVCVDNIDNPEFKFVIDNKDAYKKVTKPEYVDNYILKIASENCLTFLTDSLKSYTKSGVEKTRATISNMDIPHKSSVISILDLADVMYEGNIQKVIAKEREVLNNKDLVPLHKLVTLFNASQLVISKGAKSDVEAMLAMTEAFDKQFEKSNMLIQSVAKILKERLSKMN